jgi:hypothetical protein
MNLHELYLYIVMPIYIRVIILSYWANCKLYSLVGQNDEGRNNCKIIVENARNI